MLFNLFPHCIVLNATFSFDFEPHCFSLRMPNYNGHAYVDTVIEHWTIKSSVQTIDQLNGRLEWTDSPMLLFYASTIFIRVICQHEYCDSYWAAEVGCEFTSVIHIRQFEYGRWSKSELVYVCSGVHKIHQGVFIKFKIETQITARKWSVNEWCELTRTNITNTRVVEATQ